MPPRSPRVEAADAISGFFAAAIGKHGQLDIRLNRVAISMPGTPLGIEVNGTVTVTMHMREMSDQERRAHVAANLAAIGR